MPKRTQLPQPAACPPFCDASHSTDVLDPGTELHTGAATYVPTPTPGSGNDVETYAMRYVDEDGTVTSAVSMVVDAADCLPELPAGQARRVAAGLLAAADAIDPPANGNLGNNVNEVGSDQSFSQTRENVPGGGNNVPTTPAWLTAPCPAWCIGPHRDADHPVDRVHWSAQPQVPLTLHDPVEKAGGGYEPQSLTVYLEQPVRVAAPEVRLAIGDGGPGRETVMTVTEAKTLLRELRGLVAAATDTGDPVDTATELLRHGLGFETTADGGVRAMGRVNTALLAGGAS